jgi:tRNA(adenine34) deaminase
VTSAELMREAIAVAQESLASNDVPVGALIIDPSGKIIASGTNEREAKSDPTAHAEIVAMRKAATNGWRLDNHTLVVTLEPCAMCASVHGMKRQELQVQSGMYYAIRELFTALKLNQEF